MENTSINEKENKLKLTEISGFNSTAIRVRLVCENKDLKNEFSQGMILSESSESSLEPERIIPSSTI